MHGVQLYTQHIIWSVLCKQIATTDLDAAWQPCNPCLIGSWTGPAVLDLSLKHVH